MAYITVEFPFADTFAYVQGYYTPEEPGTMYKRNGDPGDPPCPSEFDVEIFALDHKRGYDLLPELQQMYIKTKDGRFISYLESIDNDLCAKADEEYMNREECYELEH